MSLSAGTVSIGVKPDTTGFAALLHDGISGAAGGVGMAGKFLGGLVLGGVAAGMAGIGAVVTTGLHEAMDAQKLNAQFAAGIKSTGNEAHLSVGHMDELAASVAGYSGQSFESIGKTEQLLQTFRNIKNVGPNKIFDQATVAASDMAAKMGGDASGMAIKLGKALNDPVKGIGALARVGVQFTKGQKDSIAAMVKSGDTMGAQKIILGELSKEFGGAGKAAGETLPGSLSRLHVAFGEVSKGVMEGVLPLVTPIVASIATGMDKAIPAVKGFMGHLGEVFKKDGMAGVISSVGSSITGALPGIVTKLQGWGTAFVTWVKTSVPPMLLELGKLYVKLVTWVYTVAYPAIVTQLTKWGKALVEWIAPNIAPMLAKAGELLGALGTWILNTGLPWLGSHLVQWGTAFVNWIGPIIVPLLVQLGGLLLKLGEWLWNTALPAIGTKLLEWGKAFCAWIGPMIPPFLVELGGLLLKLGAWLLGTALPAIVTKLGEWALAFAKWVPGAALGLIVEMGNLIVKLGGWIITTALPAIIIKLATWSGEFIRWVADVIRDLPGKLGDLLVKIVDWAITVPGKILSGLGDLGKLLLQGGKDVVTGLLNGLKAAPEAIKKAIEGVGKLIIDAVKAFFGIKSPSTVMAGLGGHIITGLINGIIKTQGLPGAMAKVFGNVKSGILGLIEWIGKNGGDLLGKLGLDIPGALGAIGGAIGGGSSGGGAGVEQWRGVALAALGMTGQSTDLVDILLRRMNQESTGNPNAINLTDINARNGIPSQGLMQTVPPTFAHYRLPNLSSNIYDPLSNIVASIRYTLATYGSLAAGYNRPGGYDNGGFLPVGISNVYNGTGAPERVLTDRQWDAMAGVGNGRGGMQTIILQVDGRELSRVVVNNNKDDLRRNGVSRL